jgi:hypothetical protein
MLSFTGALKVFVAVEPCDLRRGHNGLHVVRAQGAGGFRRKSGVFAVDAQLVGGIGRAVDRGDVVAEALAELDGVAAKTFLAAEDDLHFGDGVSVNLKPCTVRKWPP